MGSKRRSFFKFDCDDCGKPISGNMMTWHQINHCKPYAERKAMERLEQIKTKPFEEMTVGEIIDSNRIDEYRAWSAERMAAEPQPSIQE